MNAGRQYFAQGGLIKEKNEIQIEVLSVYSLREKLQNTSKIFNACISIGDPGFITPEGLKENVEYLLELRFHDIDRKSEMDKNQKPKLPNRYDIEKLLIFIIIQKKSVMVIRFIVTLEYTDLLQ